LSQTPSKAQLKTVYSTMISAAPLNQEFKRGTPEWGFAVSVTRELPLVYAELPEPRFCVLNVPGPRGSYRCLHIFKTSKWVPITATKVFAPKAGGKTIQGSKKKRVLAEMRVLIKPQIDLFKAEVVLPAVCPLSGKSLKTLNGKHVHVDHIYPFSKLVEEWFALENLTFEQIDLDRAGQFKDRSLGQKWFSYHKSRAKLQLVDKISNLKKGSKV
jgi:hypothetical protein